MQANAVSYCTVSRFLSQIGALPFDLPTQDVRKRTKAQPHPMPDILKTDRKCVRNTNINCKYKEDVFMKRMLCFLLVICCILPLAACDLLFMIPENPFGNGEQTMPDRETERTYDDDDDDVQHGIDNRQIQKSGVPFSK